ncbi:substrate-binding domain-containing protein [Noviherbaspirillum sedimenti]|uniref:LysR family transcriptional regulator n=1 Tax=Noviherbaspirillum sedimenti TaxID=2320865 RepID=A0A3A3G3V3_9BURK|nr:substrate-binding domain-containing protein [Noviherbaspirillum sedimenti]RJG02611.1 LysR family transcriptional regulator [Noviherbaspirillum sedimenti]
MKIEIRPEWLLKQANGLAVSLPLLLRLLTAIRDLGSINQAAARLGLSYRHAWGLLKEFDKQFGAALVQKVRGRGTQLSPLAEKLIWADKRIEARLSPFLESLASELERELAVLLSRDISALRITATHGFAVDALMKQLGANDISVDLQYRNSTEAVAALARGECDMAGFHLPEGEFRQAAAAQYLKWLNPKRHTLIHLAFRRQGLFVAKGNAKSILSLADLTREGVRFVNRQNGSGTRMLLELFLQAQGIRTSDINGYESAEFTHAAVAAYVASGMADAAFGVETAARRFDLDFIPVAREQYFFAVDSAHLNDSALALAVTLMRSDEFRKSIDALAGYDGTRSGALVDMAVFGN